MWDTIIIGAGQAGLAAGYYLQRARKSFTLLDTNPQVGGSWQNYWDSLRLFSPARYSQLPGLNFPGDPGHFPHRDEVVRYLQNYAEHFQMPVQTNTRVCDVVKRDGAFEIHTEAGDTLYARTLISAGGAFNHPNVPGIPGDRDYQGRTLHTYEYRRPDLFKGERIVVIGANNSAVQIGYELAQVADVTLAVRRPIDWWPQRVLGRNLFFWIHATGLDMLPVGIWFHLEDTDMVIDDGTYRRAVEAGTPNTRRMFTRFMPEGVLWPNGEIEAVDTVIYATGYRPDNTPFLDSLGALCPDDHTPLERGGVSTEVAGLYFMGVFGQRRAASATLRGVGADAKAIVRHLVRYLERQPVILRTP